MVLVRVRRGTQANCSNGPAPAQRSTEARAGGAALGRELLNLELGLHGHADLQLPVAKGSRWRRLGERHRASLGEVPYHGGAVVDLRDEDQTSQGNAGQVDELLPLDQVDLRLLAYPNFKLPKADPVLTAKVKRMLGADAKDYGIALLDLSDMNNVRYAEWNGHVKQNPGSVGKLLVVLGIFQALADIYPDDINARGLMGARFGVAFQLPLVMLFINRIGLVSEAMFLEKWRIAILVIFVISMLLTPADPISMLLMALPLTLLYFFGVGLCRWMPHFRNRLPEGYDP